MMLGKFSLGKKLISRPGAFRSPANHNRGDCPNQCDADTNDVENQRHSMLPNLYAREM
jgi:hypothetical protein